MSKRIVLLQALASTPADLLRLARTFDAATGDEPLDAAEWSPRDVLSHLLFVERGYQARIALILSESEPLLPFINPELATDELFISHVAVGERFRAAREETLATLQALTPGQWQKPAIHATTGRTTLRSQIQILVEHDIEHTNQLVELLQARRAAAKRAAGPVERGTT